MSAVRLVREGDLDAVRAADPSLAGLALDGERVAYLGISMGSVVGASMLAGEPDLRGLVLNVPPGSVVDTLCEGAEFRGLATGPLAGFLGIRGPFDEVGRSCAMDPIVDLFRWMLAPIDPLALAPHFFRERLVAGSSFDGSPPDVLWLLANHDQLAAPPATESMLAVAGAPGRGDFGFVELASAPSPAWRNLVAPGGGVTAVALRYAPASHGLPEVLAGTSSYEDPLDPPFVRRAAETRFDNPILDVHARTTRFLEGIARGEHATVE
jgi:pimeloyl-ACP methyl ester carboxylesterase